jgi:integrase
MASIRTKPTGSKAIQVVIADGRKAIGIGKADKKAAESYRSHIAKLESAALGGQEIPPATAKWVSQTKPHIRRRLEELELIQPAAVAERAAMTVSVLVDCYLSELDVKERTVIRYRNQLHFMQEFFGNDSDIAKLVTGDGERFLKWLKRKTKKNGEPYGPNYIHKIIKTSRQAFAFAVANNLMETNILTGVKAPEVISDEKDFEITSAMTEKILKAANPKYRLIIALARYGGLRCPSELAGLCWSHFLWDQERFIVHSPKTEHCGKSKRVVPIFGELRPHLWEAFEMAPDGQDRVFTDVDAESNLRTETQRVLTNAGITDEIPRFYQNCRSSRQTELETEFPLHVICKWLGNSERTARKHYLKVQESHFEQAVTSGVHQGVQNASEPSGTDVHAAKSRHEKTLKNISSPAFSMLSKYTREGRLQKHASALHGTCYVFTKNA